MPGAGRRRADAAVGLLPDGQGRDVRTRRAPARARSRWSATASTTRRRSPRPTSASRSASATDLARLTADVVVLGGDLRAVPWLVAHARRVRRVMRQNLAWAFGYNAVAVALAAAGLLTPLVASLAMLGSSLAVVANARRLA